MMDKNTVSPKRQGLSRVWHAFFNSLEGLRAGWYEPAFRQEAILAALIVPGAWWLGQNWAEVLVLIAVVPKISARSESGATSTACTRSARLPAGA